MRIFTLITVALTTAFSLNAQKEIVLDFNHMMAGEPFELNTDVTADAGYDLEIGRMEYYISEIIVTHDGGQVTQLTDTWLLVDAASNDVYPTGEWMIDQVESIEFSVGVDPDHNHLDPALWGQGHPLAPQNPSMHWGWASGYRFLAFEAESGMNMNQTVEIHALGDENYFSQMMDAVTSESGNTITIHIDAEYIKVIDGIDVSSGLVEHSTTNEALDALVNMRDLVFSTGTATDVTEFQPEDIRVNFYPNPASEILNVQVSHNLYQGILVLYDIIGQVIAEEEFSGKTHRLDVSLVESGTYLLAVRDGLKTISTRQVQIH